MKKKYIVPVLALTASFLLAVNGCNTDVEFGAGTKKPLSGTVTIPPYVLLNGKITANTDRVQGGYDGFTYTWEYFNDTVGDFVPITDINFAPTITLSTSESTHFAVGNVIRVTVEEDGREGTVSSQPAEIIDGSITGITISITNSNGSALNGTHVKPDTSYRLTAAVTHTIDNSGGEYPSDFLQDVIWDIDGLPDYDDLHNRPLNLIPYFIKNGILRFDDQVLVLNKLTIRATPAANESYQPETITLDIDWPFLPLVPASFRHNRDWYDAQTNSGNYYAGVDADVPIGFTLRDGKVSYFIDKGKYPLYNGTWDRIGLMLDLAEPVNLSLYSKMTVDVAVEGMGSPIQLWTSLFHGTGGGSRREAHFVDYPGYGRVFKTEDSDNDEAAPGESFNSEGITNLSSILIYLHFSERDGENGTVFYRNLRLYE